MTEAGGTGRQLGGLFTPLRNFTEDGRVSSLLRVRSLPPAGVAPAGACFPQVQPKGGSPGALSTSLRTFADSFNRCWPMRMSIHIGDFFAASWQIFLSTAGVFKTTFSFGAMPLAPLRTTWHPCTSPSPSYMWLHWLRGRRSPALKVDGQVVDLLCAGSSLRVHRVRFGLLRLVTSFQCTMQTLDPGGMELR